jgi:hypothetical protein
MSTAVIVQSTATVAAAAATVAAAAAATVAAAAAATVAAVSASRLLAILLVLILHTTFSSLVASNGKKRESEQLNRLLDNTSRS